MSEQTCAVPDCAEPVVGTVRVGRYNGRVPVCALHKATTERKNLYLPCVISADLDSMTPGEQAAAYKAAYWADTSRRPSGPSSSSTTA